jgi:hypothetical protein
MSFNQFQNFIKAKIQDKRTFGNKRFSLMGTYGNEDAADRAMKSLLQDDYYVKKIEIKGGFAVYARVRYDKRR